MFLPFYHIVRFDGIGWRSVYRVENGEVTVNGNVDDETYPVSQVVEYAEQSNPAVIWLVIDYARQRHGVSLAPADFQILDGAPTLDGMSPAEWLDAMTMD